jgi:hypothetical protein
MNTAADDRIGSFHKGIKEIPSQEYLRECFDYRDGWLFWKRRPDSHFNIPRNAAAWNGRMAGKRAGHTYKRPNGKDGYIKFSINDVSFSAHRIIWMWHNGAIPDGLQIDHINGNGFDNRIENLRLATIIQNGQNKWCPELKASGLPKGVVKIRNRFMVKISVNGTKRYLGTFTTPEEAGKIYAEAAKEIHGQFAKF